MARHSISLLVLILYSGCFVVFVHVVVGTGSDSQGEALKAFKELVAHDPFGALFDWSDELHHHCNWTGIECQFPGGNVISIALPGMGLEGEISPSLGNISSLQLLDLSSNIFSGHIPDQLGDCLELAGLSLSTNNLTGAIPSSFGRLRNLQDLILDTNFLTGGYSCKHCQLLELVRDFPVQEQPHWIFTQQHW